MNRLKIFIDGSVDPKTRTGFGAALFISPLLTSQPLPSLENLKPRVKTCQFENTSSTRLELQTLLWALNHIDKPDTKIDIYTDCQNLLGLHARRGRLEKNNYLSSKNQCLQDADLYQQYFQLCDQFEVKLIKVDGHKTSLLRDENDHLFALVDKACRKALRNHNVQPPKSSPVL